MPEHDSVIVSVVDRELALLTPEVRRSPERDGRRAHRSSLWRRTGNGWLLYFHQATPFTEQAS